MKKRHTPCRWLLSRKAETELEEIGAYTESMWGREQRNRYLDLIEECFDKLAKDPWGGNDFSSIRSGYRRKNAGEHCVFYRIAGRDEIVIMRILHQKRDIVRHILEDDLDSA
jgi:toxin ParE1/3/4